MGKSSDKSCPVCNKTFHCNAADIINCECYSIKLTDEAKKHIAATYKDCLCKDCLNKINELSLWPGLW